MRLLRTGWIIYIQIDQDFPRVTSQDLRKSNKNKTFWRCLYTGEGSEFEYRFKQWGVWSVVASTFYYARVQPAYLKERYLQDAWKWDSKIW